MKLNMGKLVQKLMGLGLIVLGWLGILIAGEADGIICLFLMGLYLMLTKQQLLGDAPEES